ncbi:MAG: trypsin-like serine protease [Deltaproteobacteria bacterium]|nr:trypsin-like serine protease [Deltaproteobacteria bacterium]
MRAANLAVSALLAAVALAACADRDPGQEPEPLGQCGSWIINGDLDTTHQAVVLVAGKDSACTGTIIDREGSKAWVLTAAHCATLDTPEFVVQGNDYNSWNALQYPVKDYQAHPNYDSKASTYDFAMLTITGASDATPVIPAQQKPDGLAPGSKLRHVGYGLTSFPNGETTERHTIVNTLDTVSTLTITYEQPYGGPCSGDSGGPGLTTSGQERVAGVISSGDQECAEMGISGRVSTVYDSFIVPYINNTPIGPQTCDECIEAATSGAGACINYVQACLSDSDCKAMLECFDGCGSSSSCLQKCVKSHAEGYKIYEKIFDCACQQACTEECKDDYTCMQSSSSSSGSSSSGSTSSSSTSSTGSSGTGGGAASSSGGTGGGATSSGSSDDGWVAGDLKNRSHEGDLQASCRAAGPGLAASASGWLALFGLGAGAAAFGRRRERGRG